MSKITPVTQPFLPPLEEFIPLLEQVWDNKWLTNNGPFHQEFEQALCDYLGVKHISLFTNGTIALVTALQALRVTGEVITTPYSFVATSHSLLWNDLTPVFVDVELDSFNIDPSKIEAAITDKTTAIMAVHCYANPCKMDEIQRIADIYGLKVIYDAAHSFGVSQQDKTILNNGDLSILSFHATKVFNTFEGGAIISSSLQLKQRIDYLKNFGFADEVTVTAPGINGKMSEINAAFGLLQLKYIDGVINKRQEIDSVYRAALTDIPGITLPPVNAEVTSNYSYFPILVTDDFPVSRDELYQAFRQQDIHARRYFYPLISDMPMYKALPSSDVKRLGNAKYLSDRVLCLPIFSDITVEQQQAVINVIRSV
ncbi:DegT/DnrJ/EryC1/StrS aminotransferase family protein [Shewanella sp. NIFS-20-20]|uniref:DegT/DnrJ/EryC1/StrS family aminotransferase n=1 Tax=Shewanella sp. NIFS-20-20 TaxID=2853806 RepID=UPI001C43B65B|nr:DegT/DnrJ/EryC1/StrS family aminotransferase [Shewanella sp. NIFS-20-20]MBV7316378.1 DegT/DnrJ/EryC1/StrS family aminotransferase [Shewanella sp. NIFS-20-20]